MNEGIVYLVNVFHDGKIIKQGVFSAYDAACEWMNSISHDCGLICVPLKMDEPNYRMKEEMH